MSWFVTNEEIYAKLEVMHQLMARHFRIVEQKEDQIMATVADVAASSAAEGTVVGSILVLVKNLKSLLDAAGTDPAALDQIKADLDARATTIAAAIIANTPSAGAGSPSIPPATAMAQAQAAAVS